MNKTKLQNEALDIFKTVKTLALEWATGVGKSRAAILCMEYEMSISDKNWYIICEETAHINNWKQEFIDAGKEKLLDRINIFCYASLNKYRDTEANLVLDEAHVTSDLRLDSLITIKADKVVILSATLPYERKILLDRWRPLVSFEITMDEAIKMNLLPEPRIYKVNVTLDNLAQKYIYQYKRGYGSKPIEITSTYQDFNTVHRKLADTKSYLINVRCTAREYYKMASFDIDMYKSEYDESGKPYVFRMYLQKGSARKRFIAEYKTPFVKKILSTVDKDKRLICFCGSTKQATELGGNLAIHSEITGNEKIIKSFANYEIDRIFPVKMLRSGQNLPGIEAGIITQLDSKSLSFIQMLGRVFRSDSPELYVLVAKDTKDEMYFNKCLEGFDTKFVFEYEQFDRSKHF